jgi:hypothetical protein
VTQPDLPTIEPERLPVEAEAQPSALLHLALTQKMDVGVIERLVALEERIQARNAAHEFAQAMAEFQCECPSIRKTSSATVTTKSGGQYRYAYAELDEIARTVNPILGRLGLSYSWDSAVTGGNVRVVCTLRHINGHSTTASFEAPAGSLSQAMSKQQEVASALTYGRRQSLVSVLGLTTCDPDADGAEVEDGPVETITPEQVDTLLALLDKRPSGAEARLLAYLGIDRLDAVPATRFDWLVRDLQAKIAAGKP